MVQQAPDRIYWVTPQTDERSTPLVCVQLGASKAAAKKKTLLDARKRGISQKLDDAESLKITSAREIFKRRA